MYHNLNKILAAKAMNTQSSGYYANNILPGAASKMGAESAYSTKVMPEAGATVRAKVPTGTPLVPTSLPNGMAIEDTVTVQIDFSAAGTDLTMNEVVLFDEAKFYQNKYGIASAFPAGSVYIGSTANNLYDSWISGLCSQSYHMLAVKIDVSTTAGASVTPDLQYNERIVRHEINTRTTTSTELEVSNYRDPNAFAQGTRIIPFTDNKGRIDRHTAWTYQVYNGAKVTLTFFVGSYARD